MGYRFWVSNYSLDDITGGTEVLGKQFSKAMGLRYMSANKVGLSDSPWYKRDNWLLSAEMDDWLRGIEGDIDMLIHNSINCWTDGIRGMDEIKAKQRAVVLCENFLKEAKAIKDVLPDYSRDKMYRDWPNQQYSLENADRIVVISDGERHTLLNQGYKKSKIRVIEPYIDLDTFIPMDKKRCREQLGWSAERRTLLFVGRAHQRKGWDLLLRAAEAFPEFDFRCVVGGSDESRENVTAYSWKDTDTLVRMYNAADALIVPSRYESFGYTFAEAMACNTVVIGTEVGLLERITHDDDLSEAGIRTFEPTVQGIRDAISNYKNHMDLRSATGAAPNIGYKSNRKIAEKRFSEQRFRRQCDELFGDWE